MPQDIRPQNAHSPFQGFQKPNEIITPNQFFDVVLPNHSTQVIRVVSFLIRETLGYTNDDGDPFQERFQFSLQQIAKGANVAPSAVKKALDEAVEARFLNCVQAAVPASPGRPSASAVYELRWHDYSEGTYVVDPRKFRGFFAAEGNRTSIPEEFFSHVIPNHPKSLIRFVGAVIRNTLGIKASHGRGRVKRAKLSYGYLERYLNLTSHTLSAAIRKALAANYIIRVEEGVFDPHRPENCRQAIYAVKWCHSPTPEAPLSTGEAGHTKNYSETTPKTTAAFHTKNYSPNKRFLNRNHSKQQVPAVKIQDSNDIEEAFRLLREIGFLERDARALAQRHSLKDIRQQIDWLKDRQPVNPLAMLRSALEGSWQAPVRSTASPLANAFAQGFYAGRWGHAQPASNPSLQDLRASEALVSKLTDIHGPCDTEDATRWGRGFGSQFGKSYPKLIPSLAYAGRVLADDLLKHHQRRAEGERIRLKRAGPPPPTPREPRDRQGWLDYVAQQEKRLREESPTAFFAFEQKRKAQRKHIDRSDLRPLLVNRMLEIFDRRETRLADLQKAFPNEIDDLETWHRRTQRARAPLLSNHSSQS